MRKRLKLLIIALLVIMTVPIVLLAQVPTQRLTENKATSTPARLHDISGMWTIFKITPGEERPPMTDWAAARFAQTKPGYGSKVQEQGNDPILTCNPSGLPRILAFRQPYEIVQNRDRTFMFYEREHAWRQIWTDSRGHPKDMEPTWMGHSVGKWDGDTFVVDTVGFNDKSWVDLYGDPHSDQMHLIERYKRIDQNTLTMQLTLDDPKAYTKVWVGDTKFYRLLPKHAEMEELLCAPEEENTYNNRIGTPAVDTSPSK